MTPDRGTPPPIRIVHLGLGGFFRAHQAWYTGAADDAADWGIAAFTGRSRALADALNRQQELYTLVVRGPDRDATVRAVRAALHAQPVRFSRVIEVSFTAQDPVVAAAAVKMRSASAGSSGAAAASKWLWSADTAPRSTKKRRRHSSAAT